MPETNNGQSPTGTIYGALLAVPDPEAKYVRVVDWQLNTIVPPQPTKRNGGTYGLVVNVDPSQLPAFAIFSRDAEGKDDLDGTMRLNTPDRTPTGMPPGVVVRATTTIDVNA